MGFSLIFIHLKIKLFKCIINLQGDFSKLLIMHGFFCCICFYCHDIFSTTDLVFYVTSFFFEPRPSSILPPWRYNSIEKQYASGHKYSAQSFSDLLCEFFLLWC